MNVKIFFQKLVDKFEAVLNESICTFNEHVFDENKILKDIACENIDDNNDNVLKNVVNIEFYREVCLILIYLTFLSMVFKI